jgi:transposase-like protein
MARYTESEKADAVAHYLEHGLADTHHKTGVPRATLRDWLVKAGHDPTDCAVHTAEQTKAAVAQHVLTLEENRARAREAFARVSVYAAEKVMSSKNGNDARGWATASAIMTDKLRLELGEATDRTEHLSPDRNPEYEEALDRTIRLVQDKAS